MTDLLFTSPLSMLFPIAAALALIAYSVCFWRGVWRLGAMVPLLLLIPVIFADIESAKRGGNLTGVLTVLASNLALVYLVAYFVVKAVATCSSHPHLGWDRCAFASVSATFLFGCVWSAFEKLIHRL